MEEVSKEGVLSSSFCPSCSLECMNSHCFCLMNNDGIVVKKLFSWRHKCLAFMCLRLSDVVLFSETLGKWTMRLWVGVKMFPHSIIRVRIYGGISYSIGVLAHLSCICNGLSGRLTDNNGSSESEKGNGNRHESLKRDQGRICLASIIRKSLINFWLLPSHFFTLRRYLQDCTIIVCSYSNTGRCLVWKSNVID